MASKVQVAFDCVSPNRMAEFWSEALGYELQPPPPGFASWDEFADAHNVPESERDTRSAIIDPDGGPRFYFQRVPESKVAKNRVHLDINLTDPSVEITERRKLVSAEADRLVGLGATRGETFEEFGSLWVVMQDPEGNEFCVH